MIVTIIIDQIQIFITIDNIDNWYQMQININVAEYWISIDWYLFAFDINYQYYQ